MVELKIEANKYTFLRGDVGKILEQHHVLFNEPSVGIIDVTEQLTATASKYLRMLPISRLIYYCRDRRQAKFNLQLLTTARKSFCDGNPFKLEEVCCGKFQSIMILYLFILKLI
jgi:hypothetical protein